MDKTMITTKTENLRDIPTWSDVPCGLNERAVVYRNGDIRLVVSQVWDDFATWAENDGQVPFYSPGGRSADTLAANDEFFPDLQELDHAYRMFGDWELVARWLRIFHDAEIAEHRTIITGYVQGSERDVLTIVTKEWRERVGADLDRVRNEVAEGRHLKEFAAWCAGDFLMAEIEVANPEPSKYEIAMSEGERDDEDGSYWELADSWIDAMDGPMHSIEDANEWLADACMSVGGYAELAAEQRQEVEANGHWVI